MPEGALLPWLQSSVLKPKEERCFTSLKTAAGAHNLEQYGPVYFKTIFRTFQVFSAKIESPSLHHVYERIRSIR